MPLLVAGGAANFVAEDALDSSKVQKSRHRAGFVSTPNQAHLHQRQQTGLQCITIAGYRSGCMTWTSLDAFVPTINTNFRHAWV